MRSSRIGFFDSGVGGLTVLEAVHSVLTEYDTLYLGDTARAPYGNRTHSQLVDFTWQACEWLFAQRCQLVIVACNSASASALREIQQKKLPQYPGKRVLGVIRPTVEELALRGYKSILVLSTETTKKSQAYVAEFEKQDPGIVVHSHACPRWAPMVEAGQAGTPEMHTEVARELELALSGAKGTQAVLLACTHFPYVKSDIEKELRGQIPVFEQGQLVAQSLKNYLMRHPEIESTLQKNRQRTYFVTGAAKLASKIAKDRFGYAVLFEQAKLK